MPPFIFYWILDFILSSDILHDIWMADFNIKALPFIKDFPGIFLLGWDVYIFKYLFMESFIENIYLWKKFFIKSFELNLSEKLPCLSGLSSAMFLPTVLPRDVKRKSEPRKLHPSKKKTLQYSIDNIQRSSFMREWWQKLN